MCLCCVIPLHMCSRIVIECCLTLFVVAVLKTFVAQDWASDSILNFHPCGPLNYCSMPSVKNPLRMIPNFLSMGCLAC